MGKKKSNKNAFRNGAARAAAPEFILEAVEPTPEFKARHALEKIKTDQGYTLRVRDKRPIDKYHRLYLIDEDRGIAERNRRGINEDQFRAADRLACNYERTSHNLSKPLDMMRVESSVNTALYPVESIVNAIHLHTRVMKDLSRCSQEIVALVCCEEKNLIDYEQAKAWRKGYGMIRLREALDELTEAFRASGKANRDTR
jgi:hypothetical protein